MKAILTITLMCITVSGFSQDYQSFIGDAEKASESKDYKKAIELYEKAFLTGKNTPLDLIRASRITAEASDKDKAFYYLNKAIDNGWNFFDFLPKIKSFESLYTDKRWTDILDKCKSIQEKDLKMVKYPNLIPMLDSMVIVDQNVRRLGTKLIGEKGESNSETQVVLRQMSQIDSSNRKVLKQIYEKYGFLGFDKVGKKGANNFWLLLQHCDRDVNFQEEVLKMMKQEVELKNADAKNYAYLIDRVKRNTNQMQIYGTQAQLNKEGTSYEPQPVIEPENLNKRRYEVGLESIESYIKVLNESRKDRLKK
jgi:hypothetical protein